MDYHTRFANIRVLASPQFEEEAKAVYRQTAKIVGWAIRQGWPFPVHLDQDDLIQECVIELWRCSGKADFCSPNWRAGVIKRHLMRLRQGCRFDKDRFNRVELEEN